MFSKTLLFSKEITLNKLTALNLLDKSKMLKPYPDILKSQYTLLLKTNVPSKLALIQKGTHDYVCRYCLLVGTPVPANQQ